VSKLIYIFKGEVDVYAEMKQNNGNENN